MKCSKHDCIQPAITFHGVSTTTHGYCAKHRCCAECGSEIVNCTCKGGHTERKEFVEYLMNMLGKDIPKFGKFK